MMTARRENERLVESLYAAVAAGDGAAASAVLAGDVDWWFHGPRRCEHMRRRLTGRPRRRRRRPSCSCRGGWRRWGAAAGGWWRKGGRATRVLGPRLGRRGRPHHPPPRVLQHLRHRPGRRRRRPLPAAARRRRSSPARRRVLAEPAWARRRRRRRRQVAAWPRARHLTRGPTHASILPGALGRPHLASHWKVGPRIHANVYVV